MLSEFQNYIRNAQMIERPTSKIKKIPNPGGNLKTASGLVRIQKQRNLSIITPQRLSNPQIISRIWTKF